MKVSYNWLKEYVGDGIPSIVKLEELLTFHAFEVDGMEDVEDDTVIDVKILPDRSSDCLSHRGIAREIASLLPTTLITDPLHTQAPELPPTDTVRVTIEDTEQCRRIAFVRMLGVEIKESPEWLQKRLRVLGQRPINTVVDATNYVMFALGQPLHVYDADILSQKDDTYHLGVRMAREGEKIITLSKEDRVLDPSVQLIVDAHTDTPLSIAGVKGGAYAEVTTHTTHIILEAGNFNPQTTRKTAQKLKLPTDAAKRFENGISPDVVMPALRELVSLIHAIAGGTCVGVADMYVSPIIQKKVTVMHTHIEKLLGILVRDDVVEDIFARIGCISETIDGGWIVLPPIERTDLLIPEDFIAEVGRIYGYTHIHAIAPTKIVISEYSARQEYSERVRNFLITEGFSEVITSSFRKKDEVTLHNALATDKGCLRSTLHYNIDEVLTRNVQNLDLLGLSRVCVFEIGTVFTKNTGKTDVVEYTALAIGVRTKQSGYIPADDTYVEEICEKLTTLLGVSLNGVLEKGIYECNFTNIYTKLPIPTTYSPYSPSASVVFVPYSVYPSMTRDIALWVAESVTAEAIEACIRIHASVLLVHLSLFDTFKKEERMSYAFRLVFQANDRTLTDEEISPIITRIESALTSQGFEIR